MSYIRRGEFFGAEIGTIITNDEYCVWIEATEITAALVQGLRWRVTYIGPNQDSGRAWYQLSYTEQIDAMIQDAVDLLAGIRFAKPNFGQMRLFDIEGNAAND